MPKSVNFWRRIRHNLVIKKINLFKVDCNKRNEFLSFGCSYCVLKTTKKKFIKFHMTKEKQWNELLPPLQYSY
ncbi:hypothetical protein SNEBB_008815 [Seison nebaliae]|nr:hypothetical protein SNEBB_008815 [Seison nebaliae]